MAVTGVWVVAENFKDLDDRFKMMVFGNEAMAGHREACSLLASTFLSRLNRSLTNRNDDLVKSKNEILKFQVLKQRTHIGLRDNASYTL